MCAYNIKLALITLVVVAVFFVLKRLLLIPMHRISEEQIAARAKENSHFMESARAIKTIKLFGQEGTRQGVWQHRLVDLLNKDIALGRWHITALATNKLLFGIESLIIVYFSAIAVMNSVMTVGMVYAFMAYKTRFISSADNIISTFIDLKLLNVHFDRLSDIVYTERDRLVEVTPQAQNTESRPASVSVENLTYKYSESAPAVLNKLSFTIARGECVAITGKSGCGKTTLLHCLMGLLPPSSGEIKIDGKRLDTAPQSRSRFAAVMQDDQCLCGNIIENITCFETTPNMDRVIAVSKLACLHEDIVQMPMHYQTLIGDMGSCLSGGQQQRLLIARALYKQPSVLFMDEATANLDVETEKRVSANIARQKITRIVVAHRPQTIEMADRILHMHKGAIRQLTKTKTGEL